MIITICAAIVLAKLKGFRVGVLLSSWTIYPALVSQCFLVYVQFSVFWGNYYFIQYAQIIKSACLFTFIIPMIAFSLYKPALIGSGFIAVGTLMNKFVMSQNGGKMPVFPTLSYLTGYVKPDTFNVVPDAIHVLGGADTKWKILADYIDVGFSILSPGDLLIHFFTLMMIFQIMKALNLRKETQV